MKPSHCGCRDSRLGVSTEALQVEQNELSAIQREAAAFFIYLFFNIWSELSCQEMCMSPWLPCFWLKMKVCVGARACVCARTRVCAHTLCHFYCRCSLTGFTSSSHPLRLDIYIFDFTFHPFTSLPPSAHKHAQTQTHTHTHIPTHSKSTRNGLFIYLLIFFSEAN